LSTSIHPRVLDIVKEADLRLGFTDVLKSPTAYETLERSVLQPRLLLWLHGRPIAMVTDGTLQARNPAIWGSADQDDLPLPISVLGSAAP
jgi:hypothetical protein